jgi:repressor LexA
MSAKLSDMQQRILRFLRHTEDRGYRPSAVEIRYAVGLVSTLAVHQELDVLRRNGFIVRDPSRGGDILVRNGDDLGPVWTEPPVQVQLLGSIAAGEPILAQENVEEDFWLPRELVGYGDGLFMLRVNGQSMTGAGINHGDYVVVRRQETAANGEIVAALLDEDATIKRLSTAGGRRLLLPANPDFDPIEVTEDVTVIGKVVTVIRTL